MNQITYILFDAANTLIHKPALWLKWDEVLILHGHHIPPADLKRIHKQVSEIINFPDRTNEEFYRVFNAKLLFALGIMPNEKLLSDLFAACTYLPWQAFGDTAVLPGLSVPLGVISNFNKSLEATLTSLLPVRFSHLIVSEAHQVRKPDPAFYKIALETIGRLPAEVLYIGDSLELDILPAQSLGMNACLIDRDNHFPFYKNRISSCSEIYDYIKHVKND